MLENRNKEFIWGPCGAPREGHRDREASCPNVPYYMLILLPGAHHPTSSTNFSISQVSLGASFIDARIRENEFMGRVWGSS